MTADLSYVACSAILTWIMLMTASVLRARAWTTRGFVAAMGNRDDLPAPSPLAGRADRAAKNMVENMVLFVALIFAARIGGADGAKVVLGASLFFWARVVYFPVYLAGIRWLRTAVWGVSLAGLVLILRTIAWP
jgi:uncharacterized MAPEG superfamily protein